MAVATDEPTYLAPEEIRRLREEAGLTPKEFAERLGVSLRTIYYWEDGRRRPGRFVIPAILRVLKKRR